MSWLNTWLALNAKGGEGARVARPAANFVASLRVWLRAGWTQHTTHLITTAHGRRETIPTDAVCGELPRPTIYALRSRAAWPCSCRATHTRCSWGRSCLGDNVCLCAVAQALATIRGVRPRRTRLTCCPSTPTSGVSVRLLSWLALCARKTVCAACSHGAWRALERVFVVAA